MSQDERIAKLRRFAPIYGANPDNVRTLMRRSQKTSAPVQTSRSPGFIEDQIPRDRSASPRTPITPVAELPPLHPFMKQLQYEKRRTDLTKSPLSMVLFRIEGLQPSELVMVRRFFEMAYHISRETDTLARFGDDLVAVLLVDTNEEGANAYTRKILGRAKELTVSTIAQTYPGHLFSNLVSGNQDPSDPHPYVPEAPTLPEPRSFIPAALSMAKESWGILKRALD